MGIKKSIFSKEFWGKLADIFTEEPLKDQIDSQFEDMLVLATDMYVSVTAVILDKDSSSLDHIRDTFFMSDEKINMLEQKIRREILVHLAVSSDTNINPTPYLVLMNLVKEAERIGDYTKNIFKVFDNKASDVSGEYLDRFEIIRNATVQLFGEIRTACTTMDPKLARKACLELTEHIVECKAVMNEMMTDPKKVENPVAVALLFRYQKRIFSHLRKIAYAQFAPFDQFGKCGQEDE